MELSTHFDRFGTALHSHIIMTMIHPSPTSTPLVDLLWLWILLAVVGSLAILYWCLWRPGWLVWRLGCLRNCCYKASCHSCSTRCNTCCCQPCSNAAANKRGQPSGGTNQLGGKTGGYLSFVTERVCFSTLWNDINYCISASPPKFHQNLYEIY